METSISIQNKPEEVAIETPFLKFSLYKTGSLAGNFTISSNNLELNRIGPALLVYQGKELLALRPIIMDPSDVEFAGEDFNDKIGSGKIAKIKMVFGEGGIDSRIKIKTELIVKVRNEKRNAIRLSLRLVEWDAPEDVALYGYAPLYSVKEESRLLLSKKLVSNDIRFYANGYQSWSINRLYHNGLKYHGGRVHVIDICNFNTDDRLGGDFMAEMVSVITDISEGSSMLLGFTTNAKQFGRILMNSTKSKGLLTKLITVCQVDSIPLSDLSKELQSSEELLIEFAIKKTGYQMLENWAKETGVLMNARISDKKKPLAGWCSWYYYYTKINEKEMLKNIEFFDKRKDFPLDLIQLDDGYQNTIGDYLTLNNKFPKSLESGNGLGWLSNEIHSTGKLAGVWIAPFFAMKKCKLLIEHPEYFIRDKKGKLVKSHYNPMWGGFLYALDLSKDEVIDYVENHARYISETWKFDFLKIDFIFCSEVLESDYAVKGYTRAQILRRGVEAVRRGMGPDKIILGCGAPLGPCIGVVDVMRIGTDTASYWSMLEVSNKWFGVNVPALKPALVATVTRAYMHNELWINDPDCVVVREAKSKLSTAEIHTQLTIFGLSGGQVFYSDDMSLLSEERIHYAKLLAPIHRSTAVANDLLYNYPPRYFSESEEMPFGDFTIAAIINWKGKRKEKLKISEIMDTRFSSKYKPDQKFVIFEYWTKKLIGFYTLNEQFVSPPIEKHGVLYVSIIPVKSEQIEEPVFLTSTLHIKQGLAEIKSWVKDKNKITIDLELAGEHSGSLYFLMPLKMDMKSDSIPVKNYDIINGKLAEVPLTLKEKGKIVLTF